VCAKTVTKNPPVFSRKINTNVWTCSVLTNFCPVWIFYFPKIEKFAQSELKTSIRKRQIYLKALSQNDFRRCFEALKVRMWQCVASDINCFEGG
jgi:hypothetical protein